jgi:hypothetical protein
VLEFRDGTKKNWQASIIHMNLHKTKMGWLVHSWTTFVARTSHGQPWIHKAHYSPDLWEATTFPHEGKVYFAPLHGGHIQMAFCPRTPKWESRNSHLELPRLWGRITSCLDFRLQWSLKQSCSLRQKISNGMLHATYMQGDLVDSWLLMVGSQIASMTFDLFLLIITCVSNVQMGNVNPF